MEKYPNIYLYKRIVQAKLFIDRNYEHYIDIGAIADEAYFSKYHFIRQFKKIYGKTPHKYLTTVRIENAMKLFRDGVSVSEVCYSIGFNSLSSFSGLFKRKVGLSPSAYLENQQQVKTQVAKTPLRFVPDCFAIKNGWAKKAILKKRLNVR